MSDIIKQQYFLVQKSRTVVLDFVESTMKVDIDTPLILCNHQTIGYLLEHIAACYQSWLTGFVNLPKTDVLTNGNNIGMGAIRQRYEKVDKLVFAFMEKYKQNIELPLILMHDACGEVHTTPQQLLTHVMTHEFHHKGQIMLMSRMLGFIPPDTDVSLFFN